MVGKTNGGQADEQALGKLGADDITTWKREIAELTGVRYAGVAKIGR